jgi:ferrochelatase
MNSARIDMAEADAGVIPAGHPKVAKSRVGVLIVNLGSPAGTDYWSMRRYLKQFLWDPRVIEVPRPLWWLILIGVILTIRPKKSGHAYATIWNNERNEAPLVTITRAPAEKLGERLGADGIVVVWAMRLGDPSLASRLEALMDVGCDRFLVAPIYPH